MASRRTALLGVLVAASLALAGCNAVLTMTALFTPSDAAGAPALKPGYWSSPYCTAADGPARSGDCANGYEITPGDMREVDDLATFNASAPRPESADAYLLVAGDPMVMQIAYANLAVGPAPGAFIFVAVKPTALDAGGRIVAAEVWPVLCGPPAPPPKPDAPVDPDGFPPSTDHPFPGMTLDDAGCIPADRTAVLNAAKASRAPADAILVLRWVADAPP